MLPETDKSHNKTSNTPNALVSESSPYLQQHAYNPVRWLAWSDESFAVAKQQDKPVFVSIGYSTCHWCHVMAEESFEDTEVASILNEYFVCIKVDREERPDIDDAYMAVCQAMTGHGGWPLSVFVTPEGKPFFTGTYFPKQTRGNRIGFIELLERIQEIWTNQREKVEVSSAEIYDSCIQISENIETVALDSALLEDTTKQLLERFDSSYGGFGSQPKFPSPHTLLYLLREYKATNNTVCLDMVNTTLRAIRSGGIFDHIGFGFHRYSTDRFWLLPHFEKMLYDQAMLMIAYSEAFAVTADPLYAQTVEEIYTYVERYLRLPSGAYASAEDADSEGVEGKFYVWTYQQIQHVLQPDDAQWFIDTFHIRQEGNYSDEHSRQSNGTNIIFLHPQQVEIVFRDTKNILRWNRCRELLLTHRDMRIRPGRDEKILTDWNSLMIVALASAGRYCQKKKYIERAEALLRALRELGLVHKSEIFHTYSLGNCSTTVFLDDVVFLAWGYTELWQSTGKSDYFDSAISLLQTISLTFTNDLQSCTIASLRTEEIISLRSKPTAYDGAIPSGNSVLCYVLARLASYLPTELRAWCQSIISSFSKQISTYPTGFTMMLLAYRLEIATVHTELVVLDNSRTLTYDTLFSRQLCALNSGELILLLDAQTNIDETQSKHPSYSFSYFTSEYYPVLFYCSLNVCHERIYSIEFIQKFLSRH